MLALTHQGFRPNLWDQLEKFWGTRVSEQTNGSLNRTAAAVQRLGSAIERLEVASTRLGAGDLLLAGELRDARDEHSHLAETTRVVAGRLDAVIGRLHVLLEE